MSRRRCYLTTPMFGALPDEVVWEMSMDERMDPEPFSSYSRYILCTTCNSRWHSRQYDRCYRCQRRRDRNTVVRVKENGQWRPAKV